MPPQADKVLIEIATIANMSGVKEAQAGMLGLGVSSLALAAGLGIVFEAGKSMVEISEKQEKADRSLEQAVKAYNDSIGKTAPLDQHAGEARAKAADVAGKAQDSLIISTNAAKIAQLAYTDAVHKHGVKSEQAYIASLHLQDANIRLAQAADTAKDAQVALAAATTEANVVVEKAAINMNFLKAHVQDFIKDNRRFISSQAEVTENWAKLTRAGLSQDEVQKDMNRALDLSALKNITLSEATDLLIKAEQGRMKGLIDLGITTGKYTDAQGNLVNGTKDVQRAMDELDPRIKNGRNSTGDLTQAQNDLSNAWQDLANRDGPALLKQLTTITDYIAANLPIWDALGNQLAKIPSVANQAGLQTNKDFRQWLREHYPAYRAVDPGDAPQTDYSGYGPASTAGQGKGRGALAFAEGGVVPGPIGAPTWAVVHGGETVTPAGGVNVSGIERRLDLLIAAVMTEPTGQTDVAAALYKAMQGAGMNRLRGMAGA